MKKTILSVMMLLSLSLTTCIASSITRNQNGKIQTVTLTCHTIDESAANTGVHRTPMQIPIVYFDNETSILYFEDACYECTIELVIPGTDIILYSSAIADGTDTFQLPTDLIGSYELHIHRGNYCFKGLIIL